MRQIQQDLLICVIGSEEMARDLARCFQAEFPRITVQTGDMTGALDLMLRYRFRVAIVATISEIKVAAGIMVRKIREHKHAPSGVFVFNANIPARSKHQYLVDEYTRDGINEMFAAAKKAAERDPYCRWLTQEEIDRAAQRTAERMADLEVQAMNGPPTRKPWILRFIKIIKWR